MPHLTTDTQVLPPRKPPSLPKTALLSHSEQPCSSPHTRQPPIHVPTNAPSAGPNCVVTPSLHPKPKTLHIAWLQSTSPKSTQLPHPHSFWIHSCHWALSHQDPPDSTNRIHWTPCNAQPGSAAYKLRILCPFPRDQRAPNSGPLHTLLLNGEGISPPAPHAYSFSAQTSPEEGLPWPQWPVTPLHTRT